MTRWPQSLTAAGEASGDRVWRMPLDDGYATALDLRRGRHLAHVARDGVARLDHGRAVPARVRGRPAVGAPGHRRPGRSAENSGELAKGATGFGVRLLLVPSARRAEPGLSPPA